MKYFDKYFITGLLVVSVVSLALPLVIPQPYALFLSMGVGLYVGAVSARLRRESENK